ncbi:FadR/GntR family transcriptional regulator [Fontivita pretiosa]|uniref:FadR/GntR family transcriptional regulator n=1 Tax=Fontivita pretiosa TaxID=2989684 RepID=UPI003D17FE66
MERDRLDNRIVREIIARVASGTYAQGKRIPSERSLCREFGVARGTLRKAMAQLRRLGVLTVRPNSGVYVRGVIPGKLPHRYLPPHFADIDLDDVVEARMAIELAAVAQATRRVGPADLKRLRDLVDRMAASLDNLPVFLDLDLAFHQALVRASGNAVLARAFEAIYDYHRFSTVYTSQREGEEAKALAYHRRLLEALHRGDASRCRLILRQHLQSIRQYARPAKMPQRS